MPVHDARVLAYLKLSGIGRCLVMNFNAMPLKIGIKRFASEHPRPALYQRADKCSLIPQLVIAGHDGRVG